GAHRIEGDEAEIEEAGNADFEVEAHSHEYEEADHQQHLSDEVPGIERKQHRKHGGDDEKTPADLAPDREGKAVQSRLHRFAAAIVNDDTKARDNKKNDGALQLQPGVGVNEVVQ